MTIKTTYNNRELTYCEHSENWTTPGFNPSPSLKALKKRIDNHEREERSFEKFSAILKSYAGCEAVIVTSLCEAEQYVWLSRPNNKNQTRSKERLADLRAATPENWARLDKINALKSQIRDLSTQADVLEKELTPLTLVDIIKPKATS